MLKWKTLKAKPRPKIMLVHNDIIFIQIEGTCLHNHP